MQLPPLRFDRLIPLFPLPNCVLFPGVVQPLHIFEPRYRLMMEETLKDQSALAMALLKPGWEKKYYGRPDIHTMVCVGRIVAHERLSDGKYNLLLHGVTRANVMREERQGTYRVAMLDALSDQAHCAAEGQSPDEWLERKALKELFEQSALRDLTVAPMVATLFEEETPLSRLIDTLTFSLVTDVGKKQLLLEELNPLIRGEMLLRELVELAGRLKDVAPAPTRSWPPQMGIN